MAFCLTLLLITTIILAIMSSWSLNTFLRLKKASKQAVSSDAFEDACHVSTTYTKGGEIIAWSMLVMSLILLGVVLYIIRSKNLTQ